MEQERDVITGEVTLEYLARRTAEGWKVAAVEWVRGEPAALQLTSFTKPKLETEVPYGLQCNSANSCLEENPLETTVLLLILEQIIQEKRVSEIAVVLNHEGFKTRNGRVWSPAAVFDLLPRLVEVGPTLLKSAVWQERRARAGLPIH